MSLGAFANKSQARLFIMRIGTRLILSFVTASVGVVWAGMLSAQTFTTLYHFPATSGQNQGGYSSNIHGASPQAPLVLSGNKLYGTAGGGGSAGWGTVFSINRDGTGFALLHTFTAVERNASGYFTNSDGIFPCARLVLSSNRFYGTTQEGGRWGFGTVFAVNIDGTGFTNLHDFPGGSEGSCPRAGLALSGTTLYGSTSGETSPGVFGSGYGTVFALQTDGTAFTNLHLFTPSTDGAAPCGPLLLSGNVLYGLAYRGGPMDLGTLFSVNTDVTGFTRLHEFEGSSDGCSPRSGLILSGNTLYGTASCGGANAAGTVFRINTDGTAFAVLHSFARITWTSEGIMNSDGYSPSATPFLAGDRLYGTAQFGGTFGSGAMFAVNTDGAGFTNPHTFTALSEYFPTVVSTNLDGANPGAGFTASGITLYGTTARGGSFGSGTIFSISFPPQLNIVHAGAYVILTWPTNYGGFDYTGFTLQSSTSLTPPDWTITAPAPVVVDGHNTVTNLISNQPRFYRLNQ
jgi:uncharacterized repeat protein (TIGR03803 family)